MVLSQLAEYFQQAPPPTPLKVLDDGQNTATSRMQQMRRQEEGIRSDTVAMKYGADDEEESRPPYLHAMLAGGLGGTTGDMLMHSIDTVKTRQQGDPHMPPKYTTMGNAYSTIFRQEGMLRGLYGGVTPAFLGSFIGTVGFFGCYEWSKRLMLDHGVHPGLSYLAAGFAADLAVSPIYVPTEVLKTRLQLQGRHNNPFFTSGYNYRSSMHALRTIYYTEGLTELFSGYKATICRDLPFSAIQFAIYEQEQSLAKGWVGPGQEIGLLLEILTGASAGGIAGTLTCPMDVVKTRIQTELDPDVIAAARQKKKQAKKVKSPGATPAQAAIPSNNHAAATPNGTSSSTPSSHRPVVVSAASSAHMNKQPRQAISTSSPSTTLKHHGQVPLDSESVLKALRIIYRTEGIGGWFRGVGPRAVWTSIQSGTMLLVYQKLLRWFDMHRLVDDDEGYRGVH